MHPIVPLAALRAALLTLGLVPAPEVDPADFGSWFEAAADGDLVIPDAVAARAARFRYVFVAGLLNERMPGYFEQNIKELEAIGVPTDAIHRVDPSSDSTFDENLAAIRRAIEGAAAEGLEPIVLIGHSRGACDALAFALNEPGFVRDRVAALFLIQGPFGGSGVADYVVGEGEPIDEQMPAPARGLARLFGNAAAKKFERGKHLGIADLASEAARDFWKRMLKVHAKAVPIVGPRTFYVEAVRSTDRQLMPRRPIARYLETYYGPNDGLVAAGDQYVPGLGTRLGTLDVGHSDLTHRFPAARPKRRLRQALADAIVMAVGGWGGHGTRRDADRTERHGSDRR